ncbi:hypothetical protein FGO68_gene7651 [Halteria grandinella]|uniref:Uncharacterized protein n=1 Tax=Halteria grandinella TaxID=5974 RepID=A0A8J8NVP6_HALGN|nr:hypothetical protein FGO68_gene7651 [Halteria grandinella]
MTNIEVTLKQPKDIEEDIDFYLNPKNNSVLFKGKQLEAEIVGDFKVKLLLIQVTGKAFVNVSNMNLTLEVALDTQKLSTNKLAPALTLEDIQIDLDPDNISIRLEGGMVTKIASLFTELFKKEIIGQIVSNTRMQAQIIVEEDINKELAQYGAEVRVPEFDSLKVDYSLVARPVVLDFIAMEINGSFVDSKQQEPLQGPRVELPYRDIKGKAFQAYISDYTLNSFNKGAFARGQNVYLTNIMATYLGVKEFPLTTTLVGKVIPQLLWKYGPDKTVHLRIRFLNQNYPVITFSDSGYRNQAQDFELGFIINNEEALTYHFGKLAHDQSFTVQDEKIHGHISPPEITNLSVSKTLLKNVTELVLTNELITFLTKATESANKYLEEGIKIPQIEDKTGTCLNFGDCQVSYSGDGYMQGEVNVRKCNETREIHFVE